MMIAYDGTCFAGWQRQKGHRSVQETIETALQGILQEKVCVTGAGRTDAGVHAKGQVAHFTLTARSQIPIATLRRALNAVLPEDVLIHDVQPAPRGFHARYSAKAKHYRYSIWNDPLRPLFGRSELLHVPQQLDLARMRRLARELRGRRDFAAFRSMPRGGGAASSSRSHTVRHLQQLTLSRKGPLLRIDAVADGFLYHMVRRIVGLLLEAGKAKPVPQIAPTAPAQGLCLMEVRYSRG